MTKTENATFEDVNRFWIEEAGEKAWYERDEAVDRQIRTRFGPLWEAARAAGTAPWTASAPQTLASVILLDQFPRNMFRDDPRAFATDPLARETAQKAIARDDDLHTDLPQRQFYYLPFEHSEDPEDQDRAVALIGERMGKGETLLHARAHREIIRRFGRFPFRNKALGRRTTPEEQAFLDAGGYGAMVRELKG